MKKYSMRALQLGFLGAELAQTEQLNEESCLFCWKKSCGCNAPDVKTDAFLNFSDDVIEHKQLKLA